MKHKKQTVTIPKSQLKSGWTIEPMPDFNLESTLSEELAEKLAKEIDNEIIKTIEFEHLVNVAGWTKVELPRFNTMMHAVDVTEWVEENCGLYDRLGSTYVFKEAKDATWFRMRWCGD